MIFSPLDNFFECHVYSDDTKTHELTPSGGLHRIRSLKRTLSLAKPYEFVLELLLPDAMAQYFDQGFKRGFGGTYVEIYHGWVTSAAHPNAPASRTLAAYGYVMAADKTDDRSPSYSITINSSMVKLAHSADLGALIMRYGYGYHSVIDFLNGINKPGTGAGQHQKGILTGSKFTAQWVDGKHKTNPPGDGISWRVDWAQRLDAVTTLSQHFNFYFREKWGSILPNAVLEIGPLRNPANYTIWGGLPLANAQNQPVANLATAQAQTYAVIQQATYNDDYSQITNVIWILGKGLQTNFVSLRPLVGGPPLGTDSKGQFQNPTNPINGWVTFQPEGSGGRLYYTKPSSVVTYNGNSFSFIAALENENEFAYGVADLTSINAYGLVDRSLKENRINQSEWLLQAAIGNIEYAAQPVPTFQFTVKQPLLSPSGVPSICLPGDVPTINYEGMVLAADIDTDATSPTYGQMIPNGNYTYLKWPPPGISPQQLDKLSRCITFEDQWTERDYTQTITMGRGVWKSKSWAKGLAAKMLNHEKTDHSHHSFKKQSWHHIPFYMSNGPGVPSGPGNAWEDNSNQTIQMNPGSIVVSDVPNASFFDDAHGVSFTLTVPDDNSTVDTWIAKSVNNNLTSINAGQTYLIFRLAFSQSGNKSGFYTTSDGTTLTFRGSVPHKHLPRYWGPNRTLKSGQYRVHLTWHHGVYEAHLTPLGVDYADGVGEPFLAAHWTDKKVGGQQVIQAWGAIGWHTIGGKDPIVLYALDAKEHRKRSRATTSGKGKKHASIFEADGGHDYLLLDESLGTLLTTHRVDHLGNHHHTGAKVHGPFHPNSATVAATPTLSGGVYTVSLQGQTPPLTAGGLQAGWTVQFSDGSQQFLTVKDIILDSSGTKNTNHLVTGFTTTSASAASLVNGTGLVWDIIDNAGQAHGHQSGGMYVAPRYKGDKRAGWAQVHFAADSTDHTKALIVYADGSTTAGAKILTQSNGQVVSVADLSLGGSELAKKLEREGVCLFDAGEYDSPNQTVTPYAGVTPGTNITPNTANFYGGNPSGIQSSWVSKTFDNNTTGNSDSILQLTTSGANSTVRWWDNSIIQEDGVQRYYQVRKNVSFEFPIYIGSTGTSALKLGASAHVAEQSGNEIFLDQDPVLMGAAASQKWTIEPGSTRQETLTVSSVDASGAGLVFATTPQAHPVNSLMVMATDASGNKVNSGGLMDGTVALGDLPSAIDAIAIGFYDGTSWYRGWWGDPTWQAPYLGGGGMVWLGKLTSKSNVWSAIHCKASELGLWAPNLPLITLQGVEIAVYSAAGGQTVYFDAHELGHTPNTKKLPHGSVKAHHKAPGSNKPRHEHPVQHHTQHPLDLHWWVGADGSIDRVYWLSNGTIERHDGTIIHPSGGAQSEAMVKRSPTGYGVSAQLTGQVSARGNYVVYNDGAAVTLKCPADSANAFTGGNVSIGANTFGILPDTFNWNARKGGGTTYQGAHDTLYRIGKIGKIVDEHTSKWNVHSHGSHAKIGGRNHGNHAHGRAHGHPAHHPHKKKKGKTSSSSSGLAFVHFS